MDKLINIINEMKSSRVSNYVIAGLDSYLLEGGCVRFFENSRNHQDQITPHSHRFDFVCMVLDGYVINHIWTESDHPNADLFQVGRLNYNGEIGSHLKMPMENSTFIKSDYKYEKGAIYSMRAEEIHSITFSKGAKVLFFEGPEKSKESFVLEPVVNGVTIKTYETKDYMFKRDEECNP